DYGAANGQAIETVGEVDRVTRTDDHQHHKSEKRDECQCPKVRMLQQVSDDHIGPNLFEEGNDELGGVHPPCLHSDQHDCNQNAGENLKQQLVTSRET